MNTSDTAYYERPARYTPGVTVPPLTLRALKKIAGEPVVPSKVCSHLKSDMGVTVYEMELEIKDDGRVVFLGIPASVTKTFQNGLYTHGVTYTLGGGRVVAYINIGIFFGDKGVTC